MSQLLGKQLAPFVCLPRLLDETKRLFPVSASDFFMSDERPDSIPPGDPITKLLVFIVIGLAVSSFASLAYSVFVIKD